MGKGTLYLIPTSLRNEPLIHELSNENLEKVKRIKHFVLETPKIGRSYLQGLGLTIRGLTFYELNENSNAEVVKEIIALLNNGNDVGIMSDAGMPGVGDMGTVLVRVAHTINIPVIPLVGPSAIMLAISSSGLNGQNFTFNGYLPKDQVKRIQAIKQLEENSRILNQSQIFIETPYRAQYLYEDLIKNCKPETYLSLSVNLTKENGYSITQKISDWQKTNTDLTKQQVVFIISK